MKLFIDDLRDPPGDDWIIARTSNEAIGYLAMWKQNGIELEEVSWDHDLGGDDTTRVVVLWMIEFNYFPKVSFIHSMNPIGRDWLEGMIDRYFPEGVK